MSLRTWINFIPARRENLHRRWDQSPSQLPTADTARDWFAGAFAGRTAQRRSSGPHQVEPVDRTGDRRRVS